ncbi:ABC transporter permease [Amorphoplanes digitatis]|uniref:Putative spermidine/putrescine transport system permease protein n=1 Tax=Actinoplanes digitatis TaxID=1868 RepID=A0A7W7MPU5_9ACTN|nr:ABC transporter permease [Actinoplanes digitatis]MBB4762082.1 putative spermidine/putrescine transport system permease protein [Actinoplanes digitatis]GID97053.1 spermidine/putrescine ABC transporter permease [Actinoplanes digitatis]
MYLTRTTRIALRIATAVILALGFVPLIVVVVNSFNSDRAFGWPPAGFTLEWWYRAAHNAGLLAALRTSVVVALLSTAVALILGTLAAMSLQRHRFFGREAVSLLVILPIALPGIVTGIALNNAFRTILGVPLSLLTLVVAHATFCVVVVFNNVIARLRRLGGDLEEASMDLGADGFTTFWRVTLPLMRTALLAGGLLAFALSFDEIIVTRFTASQATTTLPIWIMDNLFRPNQAPIVNVVATALVILSIIPIAIAQRLSGDPSGGRV